MPLKVCILPFGSPEQKMSVELRDKILRKPLGLSFSEVELEEDEQTHIGAFDGDILVGVLLLKPVGEGLVKMRQVAVDNDQQGKGVGKQMVVFAEQWCRDNGYHTIKLHARKTAVPFYNSLNYTAVEGEFEEVGIPHQKFFRHLQ